MTAEEEILEACDEWDTTLAGTVAHERAAAKVVALVQSYFVTTPGPEPGVSQPGGNP
jgi:hypothetical protein